MLFLLNDAVLDLDLKSLTPPVQAGRFSSLSLPFVLQLGSELFAESPLLHRSDPERARRLAALIATKAAHVNAALFEAPYPGCRPEQVHSKLAEVSIEIMGSLHADARNEALTPWTVDRRVWRRMAA